MNLKVRLALMNFLEFAVWGAYLTCMGNYLGTAGLGAQISWFYAIQGIVSIFMPTLMGIVADKYIQPQRVLGLCHLLAGGFMLGCWWMGLQAGFGNELPNKTAFIAMYTLSVAFFMPTIALSNTTAFTILKNNGLDTVKDFPPIRVLGTVGFIVTMWFVNCAVWEDGAFSFTLAENAHKFQYTYMQFFVSGLLSLVLFAYCFTLPECKLEKKQQATSLAETFGLNLLGRDFRPERLQTVQDQENGPVLHLLSTFGNVPAGDQRLCRSFHHEFQGKCGICPDICGQQRHASHIHLPDQRSTLYSDDPVLPEAFRHQGRDAHVDVRMGVPLRLLRCRQSSHAGRATLHPFMYRVRSGIRFLQRLGWYLRGSGMRAVCESIRTGFVHDDDKRYWCYVRHVGSR